jgi:zinc protease
MPDSGLTPQQASEEVLKLMEDLRKSPITAQELAKAKRQAIVDRAQEMKTVAGKAASLGSSWFVARDLYFSDTYLDRLGQVTQADVQHVAKTYFAPSNLTVVSLAPGTSADSTEEKPLAKGSDLQNGQLSNGIRYITCRDTKVPLVTLRAVLKGGLLAESAQDNGIGKLATRLLDKGTSSRNAEKIADEIENLGGSLSAEFGNNSFSVAVEVLESDLDKAVELLADVLLHPEFPEDEITKEKAKQLTDLKVEKDEPMVLARDAMRSALFGDSPYSLNPLGTPETLAKLDRAALKAYHSRIVAPENMVLMAGGSFDASRLSKLWEKHFASSSFPKGEKNLDFAATTFHGSGQIVPIPTTKAQAIVQIGFPGVDVTSPDRAALEVLDEALSDLASRLFIRIREKQSLAYFVGTGQLVGLNRGSFIFYAGTRPDAAEKVRAELLDEIGLIVKDGLAPAEVERSKAKLLGQRLLQDQAASIIAYKAALNLLYGLGMDRETRFNEEIQAMTPESVHEAARKYFSMQDYVCVMVQPEAAPAPAAEKSK